MVNEVQFRQLKDKAEAAKSAKDRASGELAATMGRLKNEFGCNTVAEAQALLVTLELEAEEASMAYAEAVADFEEAWNDHLAR